MRADVIALAVETTAKRRVVPFSVCPTCKKQAYVEHRMETGHEFVVLTPEEREAVWAVHKAADAADQAACEKFRRL